MHVNKSCRMEKKASNHVFQVCFRTDVDLHHINAINVDTQQVIRWIIRFSSCLIITISTTILVYDASQNRIPFFGGIARYYMENGQIIKDDNLPFRFKNNRGSDKTCQWTNDGICIPDYYGLGAGFWGFITVRVYLPPNSVIKANDLEKIPTTVGYILVASAVSLIYFV